MTAASDGVKAWFKPFARTGYAARGLIYAVIGVFAMLAAFGGGENKGSRGALQTILGSPAGDIVAFLLIAGMISYTLWRLIQSFFDTDGHGLNLKGAAIRAGLLASAGTYAILSLYTFGLWRGSRSEGSGSAGNDITETLTGFVGSRNVALILTAVFIGVGIAHIAKAVRKGYARHFRAPAGTMKVIHPIARTGLTSRGLAFLVVAFLFFYRGLNASENGGSSPGIEDALAFLQELPAGSLLLAVMGAGLIAFSAYSFLEAAWRRINIEDADVPG